MPLPFSISIRSNSKRGESGTKRTPTLCSHARATPEVALFGTENCGYQLLSKLEPAAPPKVRPVRRRTAPKPLREIATEFFPLMDVPLPFERGELLHVIVPAATMRAVGLPVNEDRLADRVQADVLVGEEGLARAIRFLRYEQ